MARSEGDCLGRIPYASLIALILCWIAVAVFCAMTYLAVNASLQQVINVFMVDVSWLNKVQLSFIVLGAVMFLVALLLALVGCLSTGANRTRIYTGWKARMGGCISCAVFLVFTYAANLFWTFAFSVVVALTFLYSLFYRVCVTVPDYTAGTCMDLSVFSPVLNVTGRPASLKICGTNLQQFCTLAETASSYYAIAYFACAAVMLSLIHFMICLAANYAHIKHGYKYLELKEVEENELGRYRDTYASYG